jgi:DNA-binding CsgD family transcriptional regulator/predicted negative regulator of RcsB-dependent stress response
LNCWKEKNNIENTGNGMRFLSRLWWFDGNRKQAENYGMQAVETLRGQPCSIAKAMAYSNMSQLKMLSNQPGECIAWGEKAVDMARELSDDETLSHALNNVGTVHMKNEPTRQTGRQMVQQSLDFALQHSYHEHAARAYTNMASSSVETKEYAFARKILAEGIQYCEERDLDSWTAYMMACKARLLLETGQWNEAYAIADNLIKNAGQASTVKIGGLVVAGVLKMRRGDDDALPLLLEAKTKAFEAMELQRLIPALAALLEYEWLTGKEAIDKVDLECTISMTVQMGNRYDTGELAFWLCKARQQKLPLGQLYAGYETGSTDQALNAAALWEQLGCPYEQALSLFEATDDDKIRAITIVQRLGADAVYEKMKGEMRGSGIKSIPRGIRKSTRSNAALLTERELDVLLLLKEGMQNKEIAARLYISAKTVDHHISAILFKLDVNSRIKAVQEAIQLEILK